MTCSVLDLVDLFWNLLVLLRVLLTTMTEMRIRKHRISRIYILYIKHLKSCCRASLVEWCVQNHKWIKKNTLCVFPKFWQRTFRTRICCISCSFTTSFSEISCMFVCAGGEQAACWRFCKLPGSETMKPASACSDLLRFPPAASQLHRKSRTLGKRDHPVILEGQRCTNLHF